MRRTLTTALAALAILLPGALSAQETSSSSGSTETPEFRPGQWGGLFSLESGSYGVGAIHFSTPDRAWVFLGNVSADHDDNLDATSIGTNLTVGRRVFSAPRGRVRAYHEIGGGLSLGWGKQGSSPAVVQHRLSYGVTAHALLGGALFVAKDISIGAEWGISGGYFHTKYTFDGGPPDDTADLWTIQAGDVSLVGAFYF